MDKLLDLLKPALPSWLITPAIVFASFLLAWPTLRDLWQSIVPSARSYASEKRRLELLKLRLEIEALREKVPNFAIDIPPQPTVISTPVTNVALSAKTRALYGAYGGLSISMITGIIATYHYFDKLTLPLTTIIFVSVFNWIFSAGIGAFVALLSRVTKRQDAFVYGVVGPLLLQIVSRTIIDWAIIE